METEAFIKYHITNDYSPTSEPIALLFTIGRLFSKKKIENIVQQEVNKGQKTFNSLAKTKVSPQEIEKAKVNFHNPKNLFHCLLLKTLISENISLQERIDWIIKEYNYILKSRISFYNREVIRENFVKGIQNTIYLFLITTSISKDKCSILKIEENLLLKKLEEQDLISEHYSWKGSIKNQKTEVAILGIFLKEKKLFHPHTNDSKIVNYLKELFSIELTPVRYSQVKTDLFPKEYNGEIDPHSKYFSTYNQYLSNIDL